MDKMNVEINQDVPGLTPVQTTLAKVPALIVIGLFAYFAFKK